MPRSALRRFERDGSAVSPVIGTILMVSITIVLAAVLMVAIPSAGPSESDVMVGLMAEMRSGNWVVTVINVQQGTVAVTEAGVQLVNESLGKAIVRYPLSGRGIDDGDGVNFDYNDNNADSLIGAGDTFLVYSGQNVTSGFLFKLFKGSMPVGKVRLI